MPIRPFSPPWSAAADEDLRQRLDRTRWPEEVPGSGWTYGTDPGFLRDICRYWRERFDWKAQVEQMAALRHFHIFSATGSIFISFTRPGKGPAPIPLILTHGWPGSFLEFVKLIPLLTDPGQPWSRSGRLVHRGRAFAAGIRILGPAGARSECIHHCRSLGSLDERTGIRALRGPGRRYRRRRDDRARLAASRSALWDSPELHSGLVPASSAPGNAALRRGGRIPCGCGPVARRTRRLRPPSAHDAADSRLRVERFSGRARGVDSGEISPLVGWRRRADSRRTARQTSPSTG